MYVIAVGYVILVCYARDDAETLLQILGKFISSGLHRCSVYGIADIFSSLPLSTFVVELLHYSERKFLAFLGCMCFADHTDTHFAETGIAKGNS